MSSSTSAVFGSELTPHVVVQHYREGAWQAPEVIAAARLDLAPQTRALHYAQSVFEGLKAYRLPDGQVALFRADAHLARLVRSCRRLALPLPPEEQLLASLRELVGLDRESVPAPPSSLYVRPLVFADDEDLISGPCNRATLTLQLAPVGPFFGDDEGLRLRTETDYVRAFPGGTGAIKFSGNYGAAMLAQRTAREQGYHEVVWLDAIERRYVEETGAMNLFLVRDGVVCTPPAGDTVLPGITRDSLLALAREGGWKTSEERIPIDADYWRGVSEVFSSGTAVGCIPIASIEHEGALLFEAGESPVQKALSKRLMDLKEGRAEDPYSWRTVC